MDWERKVQKAKDRRQDIKARDVVIVASLRRDEEYRKKLIKRANKKGVIIK